MSYRITFIAIVAWCSAATWAAPATPVAPPALSSDDAKTSYSVGFQVASDLKASGVVVDNAAMLQALADVKAGAVPSMSAEDMRATLVELKHKVALSDKQKTQQASEQRRQENLAYLAEYRKKAGVITTASGLQYQVLQAGQGKTPGAKDVVTVHYRGTTIDNKVFDSSTRKGKALSFQLDKVIPGWREGLQLMQEGGKIKLVIPPDLGYGQRGPLAERVLIFDIDLLAVQTASTDQLQSGL